MPFEAFFEQLPEAQRTNLPEADLQELWKHLDLEQSLKIIALVQPSTMLKLLGRLPEDQTQLLLLVRSARHPSFIEKLSQFIAATGSQKNLQGLLLEIRKWLKASSDGLTKETKDFLLELSDPKENELLWKQLEPKLMLELAYTTKGADEKVFSQYLLQNCDIDQLDAMQALLHPG